MKSKAALLSLLLALAPPLAVAGHGPTVVQANDLIKMRLDAIEAHLAKKDYPMAIQTAVSMFGLNATSCRGIDTHEINIRDELGNEIVAQTRLDQIIVLDPRQVAFRNARFLVSVLAHEITHCDQNQRSYSLALTNDKLLAPLKDKVTLLRTLADIDELATVAVKDSPVKAEALAKYKTIAAKNGLELTPEALIALSKRFLDDSLMYKRTLGELQEMEASLHAFELPGVIPPPAATEPKASDEFTFQFKFLLLSTNRFLQSRAIMGAIPTPQNNVACRLGNYVPFDLTMLEERNCVESVRMIQTYIAKVPN